MGSSRSGTQARPMAERHRSRGRIVMAALACAVSMLLLAFFVPAGHAATTDSQKFRDVARQEGLDIEEATVSECADALQGMGATDADISECLVAVDSNGSFTAAYVGATSDLVSTVRYACSHAQSMASSSATVTQFGSGYKVEGDDSGATGYLDRVPVYQRQRGADHDVQILRFQVRGDRCGEDSG